MAHKYGNHSYTRDSISGPMPKGMNKRKGNHYSQIIFHPCRHHRASLSLRLGGDLGAIQCEGWAENHPLRTVLRQRLRTGIGAEMGPSELVPKRVPSRRSFTFGYPVTSTKEWPSHLEGSKRSLQCCSEFLWGNPSPFSGPINDDRSKGAFRSEDDNWREGVGWSNSLGSRCWDAPSVGNKTLENSGALLAG